LSDRRFEELVDAHGPNVLNVALRITGDAQAAQDVYQEVFLTIWRRWHRYNGTMNWGAYLYRVTIRKALETVRRGRPAPAPLDDCDPPSTAAGPDSGLRLEELQHQLTAALARLPQRQADVFVLSRIESLDHAAIAEILGCTPNTVRVSLHRAIKQLAQAMSDYQSWLQR
jgi:RNA polymerase sigma-70 factor (ECF subfamily)